MNALWPNDPGFSQQVWPCFYAVDDVNTMTVIKVIIIIIIIIIKVIIDSNTVLTQRKSEIN